MHRFAVIAATMLGWLVPVPPPVVADALAANLTVDGAQTYQRIDGMGVNINVQGWNGGLLRPALDRLVGPAGSGNGASLLRVIRDPIDWVSDPADIAPLHALDPTTLDRVYSQPAMVGLFDTIAYLHFKGFRGDQLVINFMGWTPTWMGGGGAFQQPSTITPGMEPAFATMVASLMYYARRVRGLDVALLSPLNETDADCLEGPCVSASQYSDVLHAVILELDAMGLTDVRLVGPDTASPTNADTYIATMLSDSTIAARTDHLAIHTYGAVAGSRALYAGHNYWLTETGASCPSCDTGGSPTQGEWNFAEATGDDILGGLENGLGAVFYYDGYDSYYYHHDSIGYWGLLALDQATGTFSPRKRFFV